MSKTLKDLQEDASCMDQRIKDLSAKEGWSDRVDALQTQYDILVMDIHNYKDKSEGAGKMLAMRAYCVEGNRKMMGK